MIIELASIEIVWSEWEKQYEAHCQELKIKAVGATPFDAVQNLLDMYESELNEFGSRFQEELDRDD